MSQQAFIKALDGRIFGKSMLGAFLRLNEWTFARIPSRTLEIRAIRAYGRFLHVLTRKHRSRTVYFGTYFMRNRPQLELALRLIARREAPAPELKVLILGCSIGAESYSLLLAIRLRWPDIMMSVTAVDISPDAIEFARTGRYPLGASEFTDEKIFDRLTMRERGELFEACGGGLSIRSCLRDGLTWIVADAADSSLPQRLGAQDLVFANNFLCHLYPPEAERCLRNAARLVRPGGHLFVSGVDLDVRAETTRHLGLEPVTELIEEIHSGDPALTRDWPLRYWGLEPFDRKRADWQRRYCTAFHVPKGDRS